MTREPTPWSGRAILHVDMDAFFASVEQLDHPELRGRAVIVGGDPAGRGVVSAASYEARRYGVRSAMSSARAAALCPDAVWARPRGGRYQEVSMAVRAIFAEETPLVQPTSIDEAYLDVTPGRYGSEHPVDVAERIQSRVDALGVSCSIGLASSKTVAKIASDRDKPHGITVIPAGSESAFLAPLSIRLMQGIGAVTAAKLEGFGIVTLGDLAALDERSATDALGSSGPILVARAQGIDPSTVATDDTTKSVSNERTFAEDVHTPPEMRSALSALAEKVTGRLRRKGLAGRTITLKVRYGDFTTRTAQRTVLVPTDEHALVEETAWELLGTLWSPGVGVRLLGVGVSGFEERAEQLDLFAEGPAADGVREDLTRSIDAVRERFGADALRYGHTPAPRTGHGTGTNETEAEDGRRT